MMHRISSTVSSRIYSVVPSSGSADSSSCQTGFDTPVMLVVHYHHLTCNGLLCQSSDSQPVDQLAWPLLSQCPIWGHYTWLSAVPTVYISIVLVVVTISINI